MKTVFFSHTTFPVWQCKKVEREKKDNSLNLIQTSMKNSGKNVMLMMMMKTNTFYNKKKSIKDYLSTTMNE